MLRDGCPVEPGAGAAARPEPGPRAAQLGTAGPEEPLRDGQDTERRLCTRITPYLHAGQLHLHQLELHLLELVLIHSMERVESHATHVHSLLLLLLEAVRNAINGSSNGRLAGAVVLDVQVLGHHVGEFIFLLGRVEVVFLVRSDDTGYVEGAGGRCRMRHIGHRTRGRANTSGTEAGKKRRAGIGSWSSGHIVIEDRGYMKTCGSGVKVGSSVEDGK